MNEKVGIFRCLASCENSKGDKWVDNAFRSFDHVSEYCSDSAGVQLFCPVTCGLCG